MMSIELRVALVVFVSTLLVGSSLVWEITTSHPQDEFFSLAVLGPSMRLGNYYPRNSSQFKEGEQIQWYFVVENHFNSAQYVIVKLKLLNLTQVSPDDVGHIPSPVSQFTEYTRLLTQNETWKFPFSWQIQDMVRQGNNLIIRSLSVNGSKMGAEAMAVNGYNLRIITELWIYNAGSQNFEFSWSSRGEIHGTWNQIWFNATLS